MALARVWDWCWDEMGMPWDITAISSPNVLVIPARLCPMPASKRLESRSMLRQLRVSSYANLLVHEQNGGFYARQRRMDQVLQPACILPLAKSPIFALAKNARMILFRLETRFGSENGSLPRGFSSLLPCNKRPIKLFSRCWDCIAPAAPTDPKKSLRPSLE